jgi:hypothetical protein
MRGISEQKYYNVRGGVNFGYIIIPADYEGERRKLYIDNCYRRERVSLLPERGGTPLHDCLITKQALKEIYFPDDNLKLGSAVVFFTHMTTGLPIITGTISKMDESGLNFENCIAETREFEGTNVSYVFDPVNKQISIGINGTEPTSFRINVADNTQNSKIEISVSGSATIESSGLLTVNSFEEILLTNEEKSAMSIKDKMSFKNENESLKTLIDELIDAITQITVTTGVGASGTPINIQAFTDIKQRFSTLLKEE